jgi:hypothetical protein
MFIAAMDAFDPTGKVLVPLIYVVSRVGALCICLLFAIIAYRRSKHAGFLWLLIGLAFEIFTWALYSETGLRLWRKVDGSILYTALKMYNVFVAPSIFWICLAIAVWRLGVGRHAMGKVSYKEGNVV